MSDQLVTVASFWNRTEADLARCRLEGAGIRAFLADEYMGGTFWQMGNAIGGIKVQVGDRDAEQAIDILNEGDAAELPDVLRTEPDLSEPEPSVDLDKESDDDDSDEEQSPLTQRELNVDRAFLGAVIGTLFFPLQLFVFWLLIKVLVADEGLRPSKRRLAVYAAIINIPFLLAILWLFRLFLRDWSR